MFEDCIVIRRFALLSATLSSVIGVGAYASFPFEARWLDAREVVQHQQAALAHSNGIVSGRAAIMSDLPAPAVKWLQITGWVQNLAMLS